MKEIYLISDEFSTYPTDYGLFLLGDNSHYFIDRQYLPIANSLKSGLSASDLFGSDISIYESAVLFKKIEDLKASGIIVEHSGQRLEGVSQVRETFEGLCISESLQSSFIPVEFWREVVESSQLNGRLNVILTAKLDLSLIHLIEQSVKKPSIVIKITGKDIWVTRPFAHTERQNVEALISQVSANTPFEGYLKSLGHDLYYASYKSNLDLLKENKARLVSLLNCIDLKEDTITTFCLVNTKEAKHNVNTFIRQGYDFNKESSHVELADCFVNYKHDCGTRVQSPHSTLDKLMPLISPITGVITHLEKEELGAYSSIPVYKAAYNKPLYKNSFERPSNEAFIQGTMGKGETDIQSQVSAICETIERFSAIFKGYEIPIKSCQSKLDLYSYSYHDLAPYSEAQYRNFNTPEHSDSKRKQACRKYTDQETLWYKATSLIKKSPVYVPFTFCFSNTPFEDEKFGRWHSNGCAAGNTIEEATLQGLLELIERDAIAIWWYNKVARPAFSMDKLATTLLERCDQTLGKDFDYWLLDITNDVGVTVIAAIGREKASGKYSFGFGCHIVEEIAAQRALTELCQLIAAKEQNSCIFDRSKIDTGNYLMPHEDVLPANKSIQFSENLKVMIEAIAKQLDTLNIEVLLLNYTRPDIPINTVKLFAPGLCHMWPQLGNPRLYQTPVKLGWQEEALTEQTINQQGLYI
ncbi:YcaO-like family protein [Pseudoalteromonas rubra]|uniref:Bacteriocin biosynthesis protein n=1 Tax=Pseudoalteromonas rubra TaxID=43658 RepID=A0A5S3X4T4_9GAMM|nr:YcaO-like family protein [Pseudoalteromonas rubra]TMP38470.1 bacteriocin biosynthesis protein [Pseudoalteromonas rubra]